jgi:hypothetical protein
MTPTDTIFFKLAWLEVNASGTIAIGAIVALAVLLVTARLYLTTRRKT